MGARNRRDDGTDFKTLGDVTGMVNLGDLPGREADLIAIGRVAVRGDLADFSLRKFPRKGVSESRQRIARAGDAHRLIDVGPAGEGITDAAAEAGGGTTEGFDLGRVVVGLVLEHDEPLFGRS